MLTAPAPFFRATLAAAPSGAAGVFHTVREMRRLVRLSRRTPEVMQAAVSAIYHVPQKDQLSEVEALFFFVRDSVRYVRDVAGLETLADPRMTLRRLVGDCDDQATLLAALYESVGYPTRFVMAGYRSRNYEHVYLQVFAAGRWWSVDPTEDRAFGWAPPMHRVIWFEKV